MGLFLPVGSTRNLCCKESSECIKYSPRGTELLFECSYWQLRTSDKRTGPWGCAGHWGQHLLPAASPFGNSAASRLLETGSMAWGWGGKRLGTDPMQAVHLYRRCQFSVVGGEAHSVASVSSHYEAKLAVGCVDMVVWGRVWKLGMMYTCCCSHQPPWPQKEPLHLWKRLYECSHLYQHSNVHQLHLKHLFINTFLT